MGCQEVGTAWYPLPPLVRDQRDMMSAPLKLHGKRECGDEVTASPACGKDVMSA